jgi:hypothetical protein
MALDRERRPTIDSRGIASAVAGVADAAGQLARSSRMPDLPDDLANGYRALGAVGSAIADAGGVLGALAIKRREAESIAQIAEAEAQVDMEEADFEKWKASNPDPSTWESEWTNRLGKIQGIAANEKLNAGARERLGLMMTRYGGASMARVSKEAASTTFARASSAIEASVASAIDKGNFEEARQRAQGGVAGGYFHEDRATRLMMAADEGERRSIQMQADTALKLGDIEGAKSLYDSPLFQPEEKANAIATIETGAARMQQASELSVLTRTKPDEALTKLNDPTAFVAIKPDEREEARDRAQRQIDYFGNEEARTAMESVDMLPPEKIKNTSIDQLGVDFKYASPYQKFLIEQRLAVKQGKLAMNDPATFESVLTRAMAYDPTNDKNGIGAVNMEIEHEQLFSGPMLERLNEEMTKRQKREPDTPTEATDIGPALASIEEAIAGGGLFPFERPVMVDGKQVFEAAEKDPKPIGYTEVPGRFWGSKKMPVFKNDGKPVPKMEPDKIGEEKNAAVKKAIRLTLQAEVEAGKLKDQSSIMARSIELWKQKGGKIAPKAATSPAGPNPLLPSLGDMPTPSSETDFNALLKKYGH